MMNTISKIACAVEHDALHVTSTSITTCTLSQDLNPQHCHFFCKKATNTLPCPPTPPPLPSFQTLATNLEYDTVHLPSFHFPEFPVCYCSKLDSLLATDLVYTHKINILITAFTFLRFEPMSPVCRTTIASCPFLELCPASDDYGFEPKLAIDLVHCNMSS